MLGKKNLLSSFFGLIDYILRESFNEETNSLKNEFIRQMKEVNNYDKNILVLGETNIPWELNSFSLNLFQKKIYIGLPGFNERKLLFKKNLSEIENDLNEEQF